MLVLYPGSNDAAFGGGIMGGVGGSMRTYRDSSRGFVASFRVVVVESFCTENGLSLGGRLQ